MWIRESLSILEYLEELIPATFGWADMRGEDAEQRAQTRDILGLLNDATHWSLIDLVNSEPKSTIWPGLREAAMSPGVAQHARNKLHFYLARLEQWLEAKETLNAKVTTLLDLALVAQVDYQKMMYDVDWLDGHQTLRLRVVSMKQKAWFVSNSELKAIEYNRGWEVIVGK